jgi:hypothetical protein
MTESTLRGYWSLLQVQAELPSTREGRPVHPQTLRNWIVIGRKAPNGQVIKLKGKRFPGGWRVRPEDLGTFLDELTAACMRFDDPSGPVPPPPTTQARSRELDHVDHELAKIGIGIGIVTGPAPKPTAGRGAKAEAEARAEAEAKAMARRIKSAAKGRRAKAAGR